MGKDDQNNPDRSGEWQVAGEKKKKGGGGEGEGKGRRDGEKEGGSEAGKMSMGNT